jgi:hypothetical protein
MSTATDIRLIGFSGDFTDSVPKDGMQITGSLLYFSYLAGFIFQRQENLFTFPNGPITVPHGRGVVSPPAPTMGFLLGSGPDDPDTLPAIVQFGGSLISVNTEDSFGTQWVMETRETIPHVSAEKETVRVLRFISGQQEIRVDFGLKTTLAK